LASEQTDFLHLAPSSKQSLRATYDEVDLEIETIHCPLNSGHQRAGRRHSPLRAAVAGAGGDIIWTWLSDCLFSDSLVDLITSENLSGLMFRKATVLNQAGKALAQGYSEVIVTGWAGIADIDSGIKLEESCPGCGYLHYSSLTTPSKLVRQSQWDGSDFFTVWPLPRFILVTPKVERLFHQRNIGPCRFVHLSKLRAGDSGFSPGRLSYFMPVERAKKLGGLLGID
jgi:hypothetical protein